MSIQSPRVRSESYDALQFLDNPNDRTLTHSKKKTRDVFVLTTTLYEIFGRRYLEQIRRKLGDETLKVFNKVAGCFVEIQQNLEKGRSTFNRTHFPNTAKHIQDQKIRNSQELFDVFKKRSYRILPFIQRALTYVKPETACIEKVEAARVRAFGFLTQFLEQGCPQQVEAAETLDLTELYFNGGALIFNGKIVYFSQLVQMWKGNELNREKLLLLFNARFWLRDHNEEPIREFVPYQKASSFRQFLALCSIEAIQKNLNVSFSEELKKELEEIFLKNESVRSDLCYFTGKLGYLYEKDWSKFERKSKGLLQTIQLYLFLVRTQGVNPEDRSSLFSILMHRGKNWKLEGFAERSWKKPPCNQEDSELQVAFESLARLSSAILKEEIPFSRLPEKIYKDKKAAELLFFFWKKDSEDAFIDILLFFSQDKRFNLTLSICSDFCQVNETLPKEFLKFFQVCYSEVLDLLPSAAGAELLFLSPVLEMKPADHVICLGQASEKAQTFIKEMEKYRFPQDKRYWRMLRQYVLSERRISFDLLQDCRAIGMREIRHEFLESLFSKEHPAVPTAEPARREAIEIASKLQKEFHFSDLQIFLLYLEIIRLIHGNNKETYWAISKLVADLQELCPTLSKDIIYFLFRYHPLTPLERLATFKNAREKLIENKMLSHKFIIPWSMFQGVIHVANGLASVFTSDSTCLDEEEREQFRGTFFLALQASFRHSAQPITDHLQITGVTQDGAIWVDPTWKTHLGQFKPLLKKAPVGMHLQWGVYKGDPTLYISYINFRKKVGYGAFVPLRIGQLQDESFYSLLRELGKIVLEEETEVDLSPDEPDTPRTWVKAFPSAQKILSESELKEEQVGQIWDILKELKLASRTLFLACVAGLDLPPFESYEPNQVAALGHIFPSHPRGSLLPKYLLRKVTHPEWYLPDAPAEFVRELRAKFQEADGRVKPLGINLQMPGKESPIFYKVENTEQLIGEEHDSPSRYVTLSIEDGKVLSHFKYEDIEDEELLSHFDAQELLLKAFAVREQEFRDRL